MGNCICFVHIGMKRGGAERVISKLANEYANKGYTVNIVVFLVDDCGYELHDDVHIVSLVRKNKDRKRNLLYWIQGLRDHIKETDPAHVISFSMYVNLITLIACAGLKKDVLISERIDPSSDGRGPVMKLLTGLMYPHANKIVFQTRRAAGCFSKRIQMKSRIIPNPIEISCEASEYKEKKIVTVGRLDPQKNQKLLIRAFSNVVKAFPNYLLEIYGDGCLRDELQNYTESLGIAEKVCFKGNVSNVHECIKDAELFVLSSDYEGLSNALLEAMMMGLPCISTRCAGSDEVIKNGVNGFLVDVGNKKELTTKMLLVLSDNKVRKRISKNAKKSSKQFRSSFIVDKWCEYIEGINS